MCPFSFLISLHTQLSWLHRPQMCSSENNFLTYYTHTCHKSHPPITEWKKVHIFFKFCIIVFYRKCKQPQCSNTYLYYRLYKAWCDLFPRWQLEWLTNTPLTLNCWGIQTSFTSSTWVWQAFHPHPQDRQSAHFPGEFQHTTQHSAEAMKGTVWNGR